MALVYLASFPHTQHLDVPLLQRSFQLWRELQQQFENKEFDISEYIQNSSDCILRMTGGLMIGEPASELIRGTLLSAQEHRLPHEVLSPEQVAQRFPVFKLGPKEIAVFDPEAGYLIPELCIAAHLCVAERNGAELHFDEPVTSWAEFDKEKNAFKLRTHRGYYWARKLVLSVGAWATEVYGDSLKLGLSIARRQLCWFQPADADEAQRTAGLQAFKVMVALRSTSGY
jgi:sarcosine oxidase